MRALWGCMVDGRRGRPSSGRTPLDHEELHRFGRNTILSREHPGLERSWLQRLARGNRHIITRERPAFDLKQSSAGEVAYLRISHERLAF